MLYIEAHISSITAHKNHQDREWEGVADKQIRTRRSGPLCMVVGQSIAVNHSPRGGFHDCDYQDRMHLWWSWQFVAAIWRKSRASPSHRGYSLIRTADMHSPVSPFAFRAQLGIRSLYVCISNRGLNIYEHLTRKKSKPQLCLGENLRRSPHHPHSQPLCKLNP